ncbi:MAG: mechanosensitive ion channel [Luminiphilus sp.]|jgi:small conductance mechanosensitive channel|nr:mechanosensitive ion channel [Luminiphilus sp.]MDG2137911.1 mechanosensitive ion channel [Luminiphilus sp.]MDG2494670.1 mechanosensitive ion channel [Luminiphilus sp.]
MFEDLNIEAMANTFIFPYAANIALAIVIFIVGRWLANTLTDVVVRLLKKSRMDDMLISFVASITKTILLLFVAIAALNKLGIDTTSLIALLGAAGLAVGLALQNSLQNFAAGVMLIVFRPFKAGDFVELAGVAGVVENIGIFSSVLRTGDNRELIIPNGAIYGGIITNYSARSTRRVDMVFGVAYDDDLKAAKELLRSIILADDRVLSDPEPVVAVSELADSSVNFIVRPWVKSADYWPVLWDTTEKVKLEFDAQGLSIPYPQMDIHMPEKSKLATEI